MLKTFLGFELVQLKDQQKKLRKQSLPHVYNYLKVITGLLAALIVLCMPLSAFRIEGLTIVERRVIALFCFAAIMWITEGIPSWGTSVAIIVVLLFITSDNSLSFLIHRDNPLFGSLISSRKIMACFADPIIMLFIGGFLLALAATKSGLDIKLAKILLKPFGTKSENVLLGFILVTGLFSMFLSNTATAAMMLTILTPVLRSLPANGKGKMALAMAIPVGANLGGIATPIGTPPNAIALKFLNDPDGMNLGITFGDWMMLMLPFTLVLLFISWLVLKQIFPFTQKRIELKIEHEHKQELKHWQEITVYVTFAVTVLLWMTDQWTGVDANVVAMLPVGVFCVTGIVNRYDLSEINWSVLWMVAGGFALGVALQDSGLAKHLVESIPFNEWSPVLMIVGSGLICYILANFISHTATANLLLPILALAGMSAAANLAPYGGVSTLLIGVALGSSLAMILPISTPPNALAHATGFIAQKDMIKVGLIMGVIGLVFGYCVLILAGKFGLI
ncbi:MAG: SLC13/DASS family transporter [Bacteroidales bacterium]|nr:SLC13/DASS family transporter [Bacteroidales bacterium]